MEQHRSSHAFPKSKENLELQIPMGHNSELGQVVKDADRSFDFFGLPRELRDEIYDNSTTDIEIASGLDGDGSANGIQVYIEEGPVAELLPLGRKFKSEYEQRIRPRQTLMFKDTGCLAGSELPKTTRHFTRAKFMLLDDLWNHSDWVGNVLVHLRGVQHAEVEVQLGVRSKGVRHKRSNHMPLERMFFHLEYLTENPVVDSIVVYDFCYIPLDEPGMMFDEYGKQQELATWTKNGGWRLVKSTAEKEFIEV